MDVSTVTNSRILDHEGIGKVGEQKQVSLMNLLISITKCFPGMYDQYSLKQYAELGAFGPEATVLQKKLSISSANRNQTSIVYILTERRSYAMRAMMLSPEEKTPKKRLEITCMFLDVGGVLLSDGWDHHARKRACNEFSTWS